MDAIHTTVGALMAGAITSLHCAGMCGPIACGLSAMPGSEMERKLSAIGYHCSRLFSYMLVGGICGALGKQPLLWFFGSSAAFLPWVLVIVFLVFAFGLEKKLPRPTALLRFAARMRFKTAGMTPLRSGIALGLVTPLLPCGPLYLLFGACLLTGSAAKGAEFALAFGIGTVPLLWIAQHQFRRMRARLSPAAMSRVRRSLALVSALVLAWRLQGTLPTAKAEASVPPALPSCCH